MTVCLKKRSYELEMMDQQDLDLKSLELCFADIAVLNNLTLAHYQIARWVEKVSNKKEINNNLSILDLGCGDGALTHYLQSYAKKKGYKWEITGIDLDARAISFAKKNMESQVQYFSSDLLKWSHGADVVLSSLVMHHLDQEQIRNALIKILELSRVGWLIHDLQRNQFAYHLAYWVSRILRLHPMVRNDAPLSVARSLNFSEWEELTNECGNKNFKIEIISQLRTKFFIHGLRS